MTLKTRRILASIKFVKVFQVRYYKVTFPNGEVLECTDNHRIKIKDEFIEAKDLSFEKELIQTETFVYDPIKGKVAEFESRV